MRKAYKNVITVITNILGNIKDEKTNGKINIIGTNRLMEDKNIIKMKKPIKKILSYDLKLNILEIFKKKDICSNGSPKNNNNQILDLGLFFYCINF